MYWGAGGEGGEGSRDSQELSMAKNWLLGREPEVTGIASFEQFDSRH